ncbi:MAG: hypothetical protein JOS17DRAFT_737489 [Linnemannia elongata]|nr:MAG: hypothetical protein JOS17DRAFT_737489 [Linnemannia elongata]
MANGPITRTKGVPSSVFYPLFIPQLLLTSLPSASFFLSLRLFSSIPTYTQFPVHFTHISSPFLTSSFLLSSIVPRKEYTHSPLFPPISFFFALIVLSFAAEPRRRRPRTKKWRSREVFRIPSFSLTISRQS